MSDLKLLLRAALVAGPLLLAGCSGNGPAEPEPQPPESLALEPVADGLAQPTFLTAAPGGETLYAVERRGTIRVLQNGSPEPGFFLDIRDRVRTAGGEQGLLSLAFHPRFPSNGRFYVNYTDREGAVRLAVFTAAGTGPGAADPASGRTLLRVDQPFANHNGGLVAFGPDGMLYLSLGDGGSGGDPRGHGQDPTTLLGTLLRVDVDGGDPYAVPPDNPFVGSAAGRDEVWAYGLRNPWRYAFDRGRLFVADVGQNAWEEVNVVPSGRAGVNYGWSVMEGTHCFRSETCDRDGLTLPVLEYGRSQGCSITGGYVYRGSRIPGLRGHYFYGDFCSGRVWSFRAEDGGVTELSEWSFSGLDRISSFGVGADGELYIVTLDGEIFRIVPG